MFSYDSAIIRAVRNPPQTIADVLQALKTIDSTCVNEDGLKWFNWLYLAVTQAVENRVNGGGLANPAWLGVLDVQFARLYFSATFSALTGAPCPERWQALFDVRENAAIGRIQFALAGINAHINHDLCMAIDATCKATDTIPQHGSSQYNDYTTLNSTLDTLIEEAKKTLNVRLPGEPLPAVSSLEDVIAAWNVGAAREGAWANAAHLWYLPVLFADGFMGTIDGFTAVISKTLLVPVP